MSIIKQSFLSAIAFCLALAISLSLVGCKEKSHASVSSSDISSTDSSDTSSDTEEAAPNSSETTLSEPKDGTTSLETQVSTQSPTSSDSISDAKALSIEEFCINNKLFSMGETVIITVKLSKDENIKSLTVNFANSENSKKIVFNPVKVGKNTYEASYKVDFFTDSGKYSFSSLSVTDAGGNTLAVTDKDKIYTDKSFVITEAEPQYQTVTPAEIKKNIKPLGRTMYYGSALLFDRANTGFSFAGTFKGEVSVDLTVQIHEKTVCLYIYCVIDGDYDNARKIKLTESTTVLLADFKERGYHTFEVIKATEGGISKLDLTAIKYYGVLDKAPKNNDLYIEFIGDSITSGWGIYSYAELGLTAETGNQSLAEDSFLTYAAVTGRALDADISVLSTAGYDTEEQFSWEYPYTLNRKLNNERVKWSYTRTPDIIVVNLGQNDISNYKNNTDAFKVIVKSRLTQLRASFPNAHIIWVNGMMSTTLMPTITEAVAEMKDSKMHSLQLPKNTKGQEAHPNVAGQQKAGEELTAYIKENIL